jgi:CheY-like chemotaxis protein
MKKHLLIDDEEIFNYIQSEVIHNLRPEDEVVCHSSATDALHFLRTCIKNNEKWPDFIFLDIRMPEMNGFEFLEHLKEFDTTLFDSTKIYMLSSSLDERDVQRALSYPFVKGFREKPLSDSILADI